MIRSTLVAILLAGCASTPKFIEEDCPVYTDLEAVRVNPAGVPDRYLRVQAAFKVCPPEEGLAEIKRKRIELKHALISLVSSKTETELEEPLRAEKLRAEIMAMANEKVLRKSRVIDVFITGMVLE